jgi:Carboxypeptidase regulatory-like domain
VQEDIQAFDPINASGVVSTSELDPSYSRTYIVLASWAYLLPDGSPVRAGKWDLSSWMSSGSCVEGFGSFLDPHRREPCPRKSSLHWRFPIGFFPHFGQVITVSLQGVVHDPSGAVVPSASVVVRNTGTHAEVRVTTGPDGFFLAPSLPPGPYTVTIKASGFKELVSNTIVLEVDQGAQESFVLQVGAPTQAITVTASASLQRELDGLLGEWMGKVGDSWSVDFGAPVSAGQLETYRTFGSLDEYYQWARANPNLVPQGPFSRSDSYKPRRRRARRSA